LVVASLSIAWIAVSSFACLWLRHRLSSLERWMLMALTLLTGLIWLGSDESMEGAVLLSFSSSHGLTASDLLVVVPIAAAGVLVRDEISRRRGR
jgi:hypothetical protein